MTEHVRKVTMSELKVCPYCGTDDKIKKFSIVLLICLAVSVIFLSYFMYHTHLILTDVLYSHNLLVREFSDYRNNYNYRDKSYRSIPRRNMTEQIFY